MFPQHFQTPPFDLPPEAQSNDSSSESSSDSEEEDDLDAGDPFEEVDKGGVYAFKVRGGSGGGGEGVQNQEVRTLHRRVIR